MLVGATPDDAAAFATALRAVSPGELAPLEVSGLAEAVGVLLTGSVACIVAGAGAATGGWESAGEELRRVAPSAALIALTGAPTVGAAWDDVVRPTERDPALLQRVLRSGMAIARAQERLQRWAMRDPLTDLLNRRGLERVLLRENSGRERGGGPLVALLVDCDDFKRVNDQFGLSTGDAVLRHLAEVLCATVRGRDTVARVGGDEFVVLLPHTRTLEAVEVAHRIRLEVRERVRLPDQTPLTLSIGVRRLDGRVSRLDDLVEAAQEGLRTSKRSGKDQVRLVDANGSEAPLVTRPAGPVSPHRPLGHRALPVRALADGSEVKRLLVPDLADEEALVVATHRATQAALDLAWFERGLALADVSLPVLLALYPATLVERGPAAVRAAVPPSVPLERVVVTVDDQYLSGNPSLLAQRLAPLRAQGLGVALTVSDLGRACLEALILLRPDAVVLDRALTVDVATLGFKRTTLARFVEMCGALGAGVIAVGLDAPADRDGARAAGVGFGVGAAVEPSG